MTPAELLSPLLAGEAAGWHGLPPLAGDAFDALLGPPASVELLRLGFYPAERRLFARAEGDVAIWSRDGEAVMVEVATALPATALDALEKPCAVLSQEIDVEGGYAHEHLYCARGLVATVFEPFDGGAKRVIRLRGIGPVADAARFGPALYKALDDQVKWGTG
ncbi:MAG TPA: hypothetical protein VIT38_13755 [Allosphingosinicella sp.]